MAPSAPVRKILDVFDVQQLASAEGAPQPSGLRAATVDGRAVE
ncbi:hypothetical protein [Actinoplanes sp. NPDC049316]